jgi:hypothetical protein
MVNHGRMPSTVAAVLTVMLLLASCTAAAPDASEPTGTSSGRAGMSPPGRIEQAPSAIPVVGEVPEAIVSAARALLAEEVGADRAAAGRLTVAEAVTWSDGSLGCPVPGQYYTQALVPGYRIVLEVDGVDFDFRASEAGYVRLCEPAGPRNH